MKQLLIATAAVLTASAPTIAADLIVPQTYQPVTTSAGFDWSGFYIGAAIGGQGVRFATPGEPGNSGTAIDGTLFAGYNYQTGNVVFGAEADLGYSGFDVTSTCGNPIWDCNSYLNAEGSLRARLGFAAESLLFYGTAGVAVASIGGKTINPAGVEFPDSSTRLGWTAGAGVEAAFNNNWFGRLEYRYTDFGSRDMNYDTVYADTRVTSHAVRAGVGYKF